MLEYNRSHGSDGSTREGGVIPPSASRTYVRTYVHMFVCVDRVCCCYRVPQGTQQVEPRFSYTVDVRLERKLAKKLRLRTKEASAVVYVHTLMLWSIKGAVDHSLPPGGCAVRVGMLAFGTIAPSV